MNKSIEIPMALKIIVHSCTHHNFNYMSNRFPYYSPFLSPVDSHVTKGQRRRPWSFFCISLTKRMNKQSSYWWCEMLWCSYNVAVIGFVAQCRILTNNTSCTWVHFTKKYSCANSLTTFFFINAYHSSDTFYISVDFAFEATVLFSRRVSINVAIWLAGIVSQPNLAVTELVSWVGLGLGD